MLLVELHGYFAKVVHQTKLTKLTKITKLTKLTKITKLTKLTKLTKITKLSILVTKVNLILTLNPPDLLPTQIME